MPTYDYLDTVTGETLTVEQRITDEPFTHYAPHAKAFFRSSPSVGDAGGKCHRVKRQISAESGGFRLVRGDSGGWGADGYSKKPHERQNEAILGRKLTKPAT